MIIEGVILKQPILLFEIVIILLIVCKALHSLGTAGLWLFSINSVFGDALCVLIVHLRILADNGVFM